MTIAIKLLTRIIMIGCRKGGVTKTTTTVNLSYELCQFGKKVLVLDFDGQGDTTKFFAREDSEFYIGDALLDRKFDITTAIYPAIINGEEQTNLHIIPGRCGDVMIKLDMDMISLTRREERLKLHLDKVKDQYDNILIDTNSGISFLGLNVVMAATEFLFPTEHKGYSLDGGTHQIHRRTFKNQQDRQKGTRLSQPSRLTRYQSALLAGLTTLSNDITSESMELVIELLGCEREINETRFV